MRDPELIKDILVTNFNSFRNNDIAISTKYDQLSAVNPFFKEDDEWRESRRAISPMFSQTKVCVILEIIRCQIIFVVNFLVFSFLQLKAAMPAMCSVATELINFIKLSEANADLNAKDVFYAIFFLFY